MENSINKESVLELLKEWKSVIKEKKLEGEYCIIIYKTKRRISSFGEEKHVHKVLKHIDEFEARGLEILDVIPPEFGVYMELYKFD